jgi:hypothetical protein
VLEAQTSRYLSKCFYFERRLWQHLRLQRRQVKNGRPAGSLPCFLSFFLRSHLFVISHEVFCGLTALYYPTPIVA